MGGSKKKKNGGGGERKKDERSDGSKGRGNKSQTGGGHNPTERRSSSPHTEAKRPRTKSAQRKTGKFVDTFQEVVDPQTSSDATTSQTRRVTRSQTRSESTTGSPVKGDPQSVSSSQTTATISEHSNQGSRPLTTEEDEQSFFESANASFDEADRRLEAAFGAKRAGDQRDPPLKRTAKLPWSKPTTVLKQSTASDETIVKGVWTEKDLLEDTARTATVSSEVSSQDDPQTHTEDDEWGIGADIPTPPPNESDNSNDHELQSEVGSSPPHTASEEGEISDSEDDVMEISAPAPPKGKKPTHTYGDKQPAQTSGDQPRSSNVSDNQRAPAPQRAKGGPGQQPREKSAQEQLDAIRRMTQNDAKNKFDQYHFIIDTHACGHPFAFGIEIQHDPAIWSAADSQMFRSPVSYVRDGYGDIMPAGKYPLCGVACHPKFSAPKFDQQFYGAERIQAELEKLIRDCRQTGFHGMEIVVIGEFGLEFGVSKEEKAEPFPGEVSEAQKKLFVALVEVAKDTGRPIMLHIRGRTFRMQQELERLAIRYLQEAGLRQDHRIIRHSYAGGIDVAQEWVDAFDNTYFSYGPVSRSWAQAADCMDKFDPYLNRSLVETDCPLQERDEPENKGLPPNSPLRVPSHPDTALKMLTHLSRARRQELKDAARNVAAATITAFNLSEEVIMRALTCPIMAPPDTVVKIDHEEAFPGHLPKYSDGSGPQKTQKGLGQAITRKQLQQALVYAAAGGPRGNATRPNLNDDDDGRDFGDNTQKKAKSTGSNVKRDKVRRGASPAPGPAADSDDYEFTPVIRPLPTRTTTLRVDERIPLETCRQELRLDVSNASSTGLELFKECERIHKGECQPQIVGDQVRSLNRDVIKKIKPQTARDLARKWHRGRFHQSSTPSSSTT